jgi:hypothetical protein
MTGRAWGLAFGLAGVLVTGRLAGTAAAQEGVVNRAQELLGDYPLTLQLGGGISNFTEDGTKTVTGAGGLWDVRAIFGAARFLSAELAYVGSARPVDSSTLNASVLQTGVEALVRLGTRFPVKGAWYLNPYGAVGAGWNNYDLVSAEGSPGVIRGNDNIFVLPLAVGVTGGYQRFNLDVRFTYRPGWGAEMFNDLDTGARSDGLNSLALSAAVGWSF